MVFDVPEVLMPPVQLRIDKALFLKVYGRAKQPIGNAWQINPAYHYHWNDQSLLRHLCDDGNLGLLTDNGLIVIDSDINEFSHWLIDNFNTFIEKSGSSSKGLLKVHAFFDVGDVSPSGFEITKAGTHYGELRGTKENTVITPSIHACGGAYMPLKRMPVLKISLNELIDKLKPWNDNNPINDDKNKTVNEEDIKAFNKKYSLSILAVIKGLKIEKKDNNHYQGELGCHDSTGHNHFRIDAGNNRWVCYTHHVLVKNGDKTSTKYSGGGVMQLIAVKHGLIKCQDLCKHLNSLTHEQFNQAVMIAKQEYGLKIKEEGFLYHSFTVEELLNA